MRRKTKTSSIRCQGKKSWRLVRISLRSKLFRLVFRKTEVGDFQFWPGERKKDSQKINVEGRGRGRKEVSFLSCLSSTPPSLPLPRCFTCAIFGAGFDYRSRFSRVRLQRTNCHGIMSNVDNLFGPLMSAILFCSFGSAQTFSVIPSRLFLVSGR